MTGRLPVWPPGEVNNCSLSLSISLSISHSHRLENLSPPIPFQWHCPLPQKPFISSYERSSLSLSPPTTV
ncbi:hypothetical protein VNO80_04756 [Phaseolus coccineus]|uniref:Uncharacterized protein n=1 Tax=Phaseolus coccineus TaxID=3886 RepID=A0AAN9NZA2_PHACN